MRESPIFIKSFETPLRDGIAHHALINVIEPVFEPRFIHHRYACRRGAAGELGWPDVRTSLQAWNAYAARGMTWRLRRAVFDQADFRRETNDVGGHGVRAVSAPTWGPLAGGASR